MKTAKRVLLAALCAFMIIPAMVSCKKGAEDPWFSFYSRKHRLCQDWKFSFYKRVEQYNDSIISYQYDGSSFVKVTSNKSYVSSAIMKISFKKNGTYIWDEFITTDTSEYTYKEEGNWYFSGGSKDSETKEKELLVLQKGKITRTFKEGSNVTTTLYSGSGDLPANTFKILKLSSEEVKLKAEIKMNYIGAGSSESNLMIVTTEINLKKNV